MTEESAKKGERQKVCMMYKTCKMCGVVSVDHICPHRRSRQKSGDRQSDKFRKTKAWTDKSVEIRQRDRYLCQVCLKNLYNTLDTLNYNLITLCSYHHKMADKGQIPRETLYEILKENGV